MTLKDLRKSAGLSQDDVAHTLGCSKSYISRMEAGVREPNLKRILELAKLYKVGAAKIIEAIGYKSAEPCIAVYKKSTKELVAHVSSEEVVVHDDYEAEIYYS